MKKGFVFTIALVTFSLIALSLSLVYSQYNTNSMMDTNRLAVFDSIYDEIAYMENAHSDILSKAIEIDAYNNTILIKEPLPNQNAATYFANANNFSEFAEQLSSFSLKLFRHEQHLPLRLSGGAIYNHSLGFGGDAIEITGAENISGYNLSIRINQNGAIDVDWKKQKPGINVFALRVVTNNETYYSSDTINFEKASSATVYIDDASSLEFDIGDNKDIGYLKIDNTGTLTTNVTFVIELNHGISASVSFPSESINITSENYNISKTGVLKIKQ